MVPEAIQVGNARTTNWTILPCPTPAWAALVYPDADDALQRLRADLAHICRLDTPDPTQAWRERADALTAAAARLDAARLDALRFEGPGTSLEIGLLPTSHFAGGWLETVDGIRHISNVPTEEVFTSPDPERVEGEVRSTKPLLLGGTVIRGLRVRFEGGRAVEVSADEGGEVLATMTRRDEGAARLGEVALVDREGRIGALDTVFYDTLLDENAASHIALGRAFPFLATDEDSASRLNESDIHIDFMIGSTALTVTGITSDGDRVPVLRHGAWQI
jgi:aminopeptidase